MTPDAKRENRLWRKDREFSGEKRELIATNSLMGLLTQIERISNLISSYLFQIGLENSLNFMVRAWPVVREQ